jgi:hypothetical protein
VVDMMSSYKFMRELRAYNQKTIEKKCEDPMIADDMDQDHSGAMTKIATFFIFKILKITLFVILSSYFLGILFFMVCESNMTDE